LLAERVATEDEDDMLTAEDGQEAKDNNEAARLWIGAEA
jgi:hypothetical protein